MRKRKQITPAETRPYTEHENCLYQSTFSITSATQGIVSDELKKSFQGLMLPLIVILHKILLYC